MSGQDREAPAGVRLYRQALREASASRLGRLSGAEVVVIPRELCDDWLCHGNHLMAVGALRWPWRRMWICMDGHFSASEAGTHDVAVLANLFDSAGYGGTVFEGSSLALPHVRDSAGTFQSAMAEMANTFPTILRLDVFVSERSRVVLPMSSFVGVTADWHAAGKYLDIGSIDEATGTRLGALADHLVTGTLELLNCSNVETEQAEVPPTRKQRRRGEAGMVWRDILIRHGKRRTHITRRSEQEDPETASVRLHLVRGHFKTYSTEKPLLGRAAGRFWWSGHARGDADLGTVVHRSYVVAPAKTSTK